MEVMDSKDIDVSKPIDMERILSKEGGALLIKNSSIQSASEFSEFSERLGVEVASNYMNASTPRERMINKVFTSTEYPSDLSIPFHSEQSYTCNYPRFLSFYCLIQPSLGGETPIANNIEVLKKMPLDIVQRFKEKGLKYIRRFGMGIDLPWQVAFNSNSKDQVSDFCMEAGINYEWQDEVLHIEEYLPATIKHPVTGQEVWFNQANLFHPSSLDKDTYQALIDLYGLDRLPRNVTFGDGSLIPESDINRINEVFDSCRIEFKWEPNDILMLDNIIYSHARNSFAGERKILVSMMN